MKELDNNKLTEQKLSSKELYELKKRQKEEARKKETRKAVLSETPKKIGRYLLYGGIAALIIGGFVWYFATRPPIFKEEIISRNGLHWHPELKIFVKGEKQEIPANLGIGAAHNPIHTHDSSGVLHLEFQGVVRKDDLKLGRFFRLWNKDINSFGANIKMTVNGQDNTELENYAMQDKDKIELRYE